MVEDFFSPYVLWVFPFFFVVYLITCGFIFALTVTIAAFVITFAAAWVMDNLL